MSIQKFQCENEVRKWADAACADGVEIDGKFYKMQGNGDKGPVDDLLLRACHEMEMSGEKLQGPNGEPPAIYFAKCFQQRLGVWDVPNITDTKNDAWLQPTLNGRAVRYTELLQEYQGDRKAAEAALAAEAETYGASLGNLKPGTAPNAPDARTKKNGANGKTHSENPWWKLRDRETGVVDQVAAAECGRIMDSNKALALRLAAAAGVDVLTGIVRKGT